MYCVLHRTNKYQQITYDFRIKSTNIISRNSNCGFGDFLQSLGKIYLVGHSLVPRVPFNDSLPLTFPFLRRMHEANNFPISHTQRGRKEERNGKKILSLQMRTHTRRTEMTPWTDAKKAKFFFPAIRIFGVPYTFAIERRIKNPWPFLTCMCILILLRTRGSFPALKAK